MSKRGHAYKQRFKGIENFLRRVAFNLGNTPSQTEVKIISCIPIDVTDLQQKINCLEKELREVKCTSAYKASISKHTPTRHSTPIVQTVLGKPIPIFSKSKNKVSCKCSQAKISVANQACNTKSLTNKRGFKRGKSNVCIVSSLSSSGNKEMYRFTYSDSNIGEVLPSVTPEKISKIGSKIVPKRLQKVLKKKPRKKTHLVYFAQAINTPFNSFNKSFESEKKIVVTNKDLISRSYINDIIRKQYEQEMVMDKLTDISQFSSPVCRDDDNVEDARASDISHSYDKYENLDKFLPKRNYNFNIAVNNNLAIDPGPFSLHYQHDHNSYNRYYNSEDYDIYPVKEKSMKEKREDGQIKQMKRLNIECWPENYRTKHNLNSLLTLQNPELIEEHNYKYQTNKTHHKNTNDQIVTNVRRKRNTNNERPISEFCGPKMCSIDYGDVYTKRNLISSGIQKPKKISPTHKNAECVTVNTNNTESQTVESKGVQLNIPDDNKAEFALNQIKTILQTVLTEVKTNIKCNNVVTKPKRDVVIQKDISHNNITYGSTLLNSFTYNPSYNINPCVASYPRQIPNFCYANVPLKCFPNYPFMVPTIKHQDCQCEEKISDPKMKPPIETKPAATATTNTDVAQRPSHRNETVNLINEIYKSIALNVNYSSKNLSRISIGCQKKTMHPELNMQKMAIVEQQSTEEKETQFDTPTVVLTCNTNNDNTYSCLRSTVTESRSESSRTIDRSANAKSINCDESKEGDTAGQIENETTDQNESRDKNDVTVSSSNTSEDTLVADNTSEKREKSGLFHKMLKTVKMFKRRGNRREHINAKDENQLQEESPTTSESQTIYSYKTYKHIKPSSAETVVKLTSHTDGRKKTSKHFRENSRKLSPYMEQEYRRYWDEKLMFHEKHSPMHSSEKSFPGWTRSPQSPMFCRGHEAKSVILKKRQSKPEAMESYRRKIEPMQRERTGLKLEWHRKQKFRTPITEHA